ncbi:MAG: NAD-binding protein [Actinomycetota bacterium]|nr:NAD-binding protein [Actinomycetota bacterium]
MSVVGTMWFWVVEGWSVVDAMYQTATTVTTVGLGEVRPFDSSAKLFSIALSIVGVSAALFTLGGVFEQQLEHQLARFGRRRMDRRIEALSGHAIVCGYGRVGSQIARFIAARGQALVVVDASEDRCATATADGYLAVCGDCTEDDTLLFAGIERAATLIVSLGDDAAAISAVLSARVLNAEMRIVARANAMSSEAKLKRAGCDRVVNPLSQGAQRMAAFAQQPAVADFLDVVVHDGSLEYRLEEMKLEDGSPLAGAGLGEAHIRARTGALVLALRNADGTFVSNPAADVILAAGATLIVIGTADQLGALQTILGGAAARR